MKEEDKEETDKGEEEEEKEKEGEEEKDKEKEKEEVTAETCNPPLTLSASLLNSLLLTPHPLRSLTPSIHILHPPPTPTTHTHTPTLTPHLANHQFKASD